MSEMISVVIPVHNGEKFLQTCLQSLVQQTYPDMEIIIIDDASNDETKAIAQKFVIKDKRFSVIENVQQRGTSLSRKKGVEAAKGEYIVFVDADDYVQQNLLEKLICSIDKNDICICNHFEDHNGNIEKIAMLSKPGVYSGQDLELVKEKMVYSPQGFAGMSLHGTLWGKMYRRNLLAQNIQYFDNGLWFSEDHYVLTAAMLDAKSCVIIPDYLYFYRRYGEQTVCSPRDDFYNNSCLLYQQWEKQFKKKQAPQALINANKEYFLANIDQSIKRFVKNKDKSKHECILFMKAIYRNDQVMNLLQNVDLHIFDRSTCKYLTWLKFGWLRLIYYSLKLGGS